LAAIDYIKYDRVL